MSPTAIINETVTDVTPAVLALKLTLNAPIMGGRVWYQKI